MSMPKVVMKRRGVPAGSVIVYDQSVPVKHTHNYHGLNCPLMTSPNGKCLVSTGAKSCLETCVFHGANCQVGRCLSCWLESGTITTHHFMPTLPRKRKFKPQPKPEKHAWKRNGDDK